MWGCYMGKCVLLHVFLFIFFLSNQAGHANDAANKAFNEAAAEFINKLNAIGGKLDRPTVLAKANELHNALAAKNLGDLSNKPELEAATDQLSDLLKDVTPKTLEDKDLFEKLDQTQRTIFLKIHEDRHEALIKLALSHLNAVIVGVTTNNNEFKPVYELRLKKLKADPEVQKALLEIVAAIAKLRNDPPSDSNKLASAHLILTKLVLDLRDDEARLARLREKPNTSKYLNELETAARGLESSVKEPLKIHIVRAWYGQLRSTWRQGNQCGATNAMRAECQEKLECSSPETAANAVIDPIPLCGYDPAEFARGAARGLVVQYSCERGSTDHWEKLARRPTIDPVSGKKYSRANHNMKSAVLRSGSMKIRCSYPVKVQ